MQNRTIRSRGSIAVVLLVGLAAVVGFGLVVAVQSASAPSASSPATGASIAGLQSTASTSASTTASVEPSMTSPSPLPATPQPTPKPEPLPSLLGAIGDSYTQAWSTSAANHGDHPEFSWVVGTRAGDGVLSLLERLRALGATPQVVDAATSGTQMKDAVRQANLIVTAARRLKAGQTAYVTFELGTNDLCASPAPITGPAAFGAQLGGAIEILRAGLPAGSRILMLAVPDFPHFHDITQADRLASAVLAKTSIKGGCPPYLGNNDYMPVAVADDYMNQYNQALYSACTDLENGDGATGRLHCTYNGGLLAESDFVVGDLSSYDYFHPSLSGQARMAADAWSADIWGRGPLGGRALPPAAGLIPA